MRRITKAKPITKMFTVTKNNHEQTTITKSTVKKTKTTIIDETIKLDTKILLVTKTNVFI